MAFSAYARFVAVLLLVSGCQMSKVALLLPAQPTAYAPRPAAPAGLAPSGGTASGLPHRPRHSATDLPRPRWLRPAAAALPRVSQLRPPKLKLLWRYQSHQLRLIRPAEAAARHIERDYTPLVLALLLVALGILLLSASAVGLSGSYVPLIGVLILLLAGVVYFHWRYENQ